MRMIRRWIATVILLTLAVSAAGMAEGGIVLLTHGIELEDGVEVHELDAGDIVNLAARDDVLEIIVHGGKCNRIAIRARVP